MMARYSPEKNIDMAIRAFAKVVEKAPQAKLELYGFGKAEKDLRLLIETLSLQKHVFVKGFVEDPGSIYDEAGISLLTSRVEGFSLTVMESLSHGCPVISFNINYGPSDMIDNSKNGYLIKFGDEDKLASRMLTLLTQPDRLQRMSENAYSSAQSFNADTFAEKWQTLFKSIRSEQMPSQLVEPVTSSFLVEDLVLQHLSLGTSRSQTMADETAGQPQALAKADAEYSLDNLSESVRNQVLSLRVADQEIARLKQQLAITQTARTAYANAVEIGLRERQRKIEP